MEKDRLEVLAKNAKTLRGTLSPNENPVAGAIPGFPCVYFDAGRATRVSIKRPASHNTLLSTDCLYQRNCRSASGNFGSGAVIAERAMILIRGFASVGIIALVDEATGYQYERPRRDLEEYLKKFLSEGLRRWVRTFPGDYFKHLCRLKGVQLRPGHEIASIFWASYE